MIKELLGDEYVGYLEAMKLTTIGAFEESQKRLSIRKAMLETAYWNSEQYGPVLQESIIALEQEIHVLGFRLADIREELKELELEEDED